MATHNDLGHWGEDVAARYLESKGYYIRHRDWKYGRRDLDIVAIDEMQTTLVIAEVKTRRNADFIEPEQAVTPEKMRNLMIAANAYVKQHNVVADVRFDIISVVGTNYDDVKINHIEDAFLP